MLQATQRQIDRLTKYLKPDTKLNLETRTRYFSQRDNYTMIHRTCNSSSNAMYLDWLLRVTGRNGLNNDNGYLKIVLSFGDTIYHENQTKAIKYYGFSTKWNYDNDLPFVIDLLNTGIPIPVNILHRGNVNNPTGGHIILLIGKDNNELIAHDPYGTLSSNYTNRNGAYSRIGLSEFIKRWQGGYRILA